LRLSPRGYLVCHEEGTEPVPVEKEAYMLRLLQAALNPRLSLAESVQRWVTLQEAPHRRRPQVDRLAERGDFADSLLP
jgi:hypothetical protein